MRVRRPTQHALHMHAVRALCMVHGMLVVLLCAPAGLMQLGCDGPSSSDRMLCRWPLLLCLVVLCDGACPALSRPDQRSARVYVTMCADVFIHKMDQWRSARSSTELSIITRNFNSGQLTLLTHELHRAPSARSKAFERQLLTSCRSRPQTPRQIARREYSHQK